jgi:hypothetical protein
MRVPLGLRIVIGLVVGRLLTTLASAVQKVLVLPVSAMAIVWDEVGGSTTSVVLRASGHEIISDKMGARLGVLGVLDFPRRQLLAMQRGRREDMMLHPPCMLNTVASSIRPSFLWLHLSDVCSLTALNPCDQQYYILPPLILTNGVTLAGAVVAAAAISGAGGALPGVMIAVAPLAPW